MTHGPLLVVDWDFFFPQAPADSADHLYLFDWGHAESWMYIVALWESRAAAFINNNRPLPRCRGFEDFWDRFDIAPDAVVYTDESNSGTANPAVEEGTTEVWLYDAHHDAGYGRRSVKQSRDTGLWSCENWMVMYGDRLGWRNLHHRYPLHRPDAFEEEPRPQHQFDRRFDDPDEPTPRFEKVFVCRSGAWVPSWCDDQYHQFLGLVDRPKVELRPLVERRYDPAAVEVMAQHYAGLLTPDMVREINSEVRPLITPC